MLCRPKSVDPTKRHGSAGRTREAYPPTTPRSVRTVVAGGAILLGSRRYFSLATYAAMSPASIRDRFIFGILA